MIPEFKFIQNNGYSIENPRAYIGGNFDPIVDKINELIKIINKQELQIKQLQKEVDILNTKHHKYDNY